MTKRPILSLKKVPASFEKKEVEEKFKPQAKIPAKNQAKAQEKAKQVQPQISPYKKFLVAQDKSLTIIRWLSELYAPLFQTENPKPLKIGIFKDLLESLAFLDSCPFSKLSIRKAVSFYTHWHKYHDAIIHETHRYDLTGTAVELITEKQKIYAQESLTHYKEKRDEQSKAKNPKAENPSSSEGE